MKCTTSINLSPRREYPGDMSPAEVAELRDSIAFVCGHNEKAGRDILDACFDSWLEEEIKAGRIKEKFRGCRAQWISAPLPGIAG